jgi:hypothetical protein
MLFERQHAGRDDRHAGVRRRSRRESLALFLSRTTSMRTPGFLEGRKKT